jgi:hypothetical protein
VVRQDRELCRIVERAVPADELTAVSESLRGLRQ